jgi:hypothetical protein
VKLKEKVAIFSWKKKSEKLRILISEHARSRVTDLTPNLTHEREWNIFKLKPENLISNPYSISNPTTANFIFDQSAHLFTFWCLAN